MITYISIKFVRKKFTWKSHKFADEKKSTYSDKRLSDIMKTNFGNIILL